MMGKSLILVSGYGAPGEEDIALYQIEASGRVQKLFGMCHGRAPSFCCRGGNGLVYAASERSDGADIAAYELRGEELREVGTFAVPGRGLCHLHASGGVLFGSCYESGEYFAVDEKLEKVLWQFARPNAHAHWAYTVGEQLYLADLGNDCLYRYELAGGLPEGEPVILPQPQGSGPRQILMWETGKLACVNELDGMLRVLDTDGACLAAELASGRKEIANGPGGACLDGSGNLYVCNRGPNTLSAWRWEAGRLARGQEWSTGNWPRHIAALAGSGHVVAACMRSHEVLGYEFRAGEPMESFRLPLAGASCVLEL